VLLRHGETEWSRSGQHTGLTDVPLTPRGEELAREAATLLRGRTFAAVLTSPLVRARRTAELAGLTGAETEPRLVEWDYGGYEGLTTPEIRARVGYAWTVFANGVVPGDTPGETVHDVAGRARGVIDRVLPLLADGDVALVGHGHALRVLASVFLEQDPCFGAQLVLDAGSVSVLGHEHGVRAVQSWNRTPA
jgi:probable phosphoglycerate mutase